MERRGGRQKSSQVAAGSYKHRSEQEDRAFLPPNLCLLLFVSLVGAHIHTRYCSRRRPAHAMLPTLLTDDRKKNALVLQRGALLRGALLCALCLAVVLGGILAAGWEIHLLRSSTAQAQREALVAAHHSSVQLVSRTLSLQSELDMQEDHDRAVLQLYLQLEREALPHLLLQLTTATAGCGDEARQRVSDATTSLRREMHAHSTQMLDKLQKAPLHPLHPLRPLRPLHPLHRPTCGHCSCRWLREHGRAPTS